MEKISLNRQQKLLAVGSGVFLVSLVLLLFIYLPLGSRLRRAGEELSRVQSELYVVRETVQSAKEMVGGSFSLPGQKEISLIMDEMTALGKDLGVDFRSIRPKEIETTDFDYQLLPIEITLESNYRKLGLFMGSLRELKKGFIAVEHFEIERDEETLPRLNCRLLVKVVLGP